MENCKQNIGIENMKRKYPSLEYVQQDNECIFVGELVLNHAYMMFVLPVSLVIKL